MKLHPLLGHFRLMAAFVPWLFLYIGVLDAAEIWQLDNLKRIGGHPVKVIGAPRVIDAGGAKAVLFDGAHDGLFIPAIPFAGARAFTIEILFQPAKGGLAEQRFFHAQDVDESRAMIETRLNRYGGWWLDTYLFSRPPSPEQGLTLVDPRRIHPTGQWYWAALRYDGRKMTHFVNGAKELEGEESFAVFGPGEISLGVRQNKVFWFKGAIREVRFHKVALPETELQRGE